MATTYSSPALAQKIARNYGCQAKPIKVEMVGAKAVNDLLKQIERGRAKAHSKPLKLG